MFVSKILTSNRFGDHYFIAYRRAPRGFKYRWTRVPLFPGPEVEVEAHEVPEPIRERAYDLFEGDRLRERAEVTL
jgi:hypothetical protein